MISEILKQDDYYTQKSRNFEVGRLAYVPILFTPSIDELRQLQFDEDGNINDIKKLDTASFTAASHKPFADPFRLEINEEVLTIKSKKRPALLLCQAKDKSIWELIPPNRILDRYLKLGKEWLVLPIYSFHVFSHDDDIFKFLVESLYFPSFFPFVSNKECPIEDSFGRLDRIQPVHMTTIELSNYCMKEELLQIIFEALATFLTGVEFGKIYPYLRRDFISELRNQKFLT